MKSGKLLARKLADVAFGGIAFDIELLDVRKNCEFTNYFLIMSGKNRIHLDALRDRIMEFASKNGVPHYGHEGKPDSGWIIIDFGDLIVHIFLPEMRGFYNLAGIWGDAKTVELELKDPAAKPAQRKTPGNAKK